MESNPPSTQTRIHVLFAAIGAAALLILIMGVPAYNKFMHSRRQLGMQIGARADLEMVLERETDFFEKNKTFTTDLAALNFDIPKKVAFLYKFGFVRPMIDAPAQVISLEGKQIDHVPTRMNLDLLLASNPKLEIEISPNTKLGTIDFPKLGSYCPDCTASKTGFKLVAAANLDDDPVLDVWTVDEKGVITHVVNDL